MERTTLRFTRIFTWAAVSLFALYSPCFAVSFTHLLDIAEDGSTDSQVEITVDDHTTGTIQFKVKVKDPYIADIRGVFFDLVDFKESLDKNHFSGGDITQIAIKENSVNKVGGGNNINPLDPFDIGLEIGSQGIGKDDIRETIFTMSDLGGVLTARDFSRFGARLTSVGQNRNGSSKLMSVPSYGTAPTPEPGTIILLGMGMVLLAIRRKHNIL